MKKEVVLAVILGITFGLVITFGIYTANKALRNRQQNTTENTQDQPSSSASTTQVTQIIAPEDGEIVSANTVRLTGTTFPNADVIIFVENDDYVTTSDTTGNFSAELTLTGGSNIIRTTVTAKDGRQEKDQRVVVFSTANLDEVASASARPSLLPTPKASPKASPSIKPSPTAKASPSTTP